MNISSRTPDGEPVQCPLCRGHVVVEPSIFFGDTTCPKCGHLLWFLRVTNGNHIFATRRHEPLRNRVLEMLAEQLGVNRDLVANNPNLFNDIGADSLDKVELIMELEEEFDLS